MKYRATNWVSAMATRCHIVNTVPAVTHSATLRAMNEMRYPVPTEMSRATATPLKIAFPLRVSEIRRRYRS